MSEVNSEGQNRCKSAWVEINKIYCCIETLDLPLSIYLYVNRCGTLSKSKYVLCSLLYKFFSFIVACKSFEVIACEIKENWSGSTCTISFGFCISFCIWIMAYQRHLSAICSEKMRGNFIEKLAKFWTKIAKSAIDWVLTVCILLHQSGTHQDSGNSYWVFLRKSGKYILSLL